MYLPKIILIFAYFIAVHLFAFFIKYLQNVDFFLCFNCMEMDSNITIYDYIVVGSGSAGSIIAHRLSQQNNTKVLVIEAGAKGSGLLNIPSVGLMLQQTDFDWKYQTTPQESACLGLKNHVSKWPQGKMIGGTSMLNNMLYVRGHPLDYNEWFKDSPDFDCSVDILPYFRRVEKQYNEDYSTVFLDKLGYTSKLPKFVFDAAKQLGFKIFEENLNCNIGFDSPKITVRNGRRWTPSHLLQSKTKPNLKIRVNTLVEKVLFKDSYEAYGVQYSHMGHSYTAKASKAVILSAGVVGTPKILLLSGIGPKAHLDSVKIKQKIELPVGENLQDHVTTGLDLVVLDQRLDIGIAEMLSPFSAFSYFAYGTGPWTTVGCEATAYINSDLFSCRLNHIDASHCKKYLNKKPDLQLMIMSLGVAEDSGVYLRHLVGIDDKTWSGYFEPVNQTTASFLPVLLHPKSRGYVRLSDKNPKTPPVINPNYLSHPQDIDGLLRGIHVVKSLLLTSSMKELGAKLNRNLMPGCEMYKFDSRPYWECYVRHLTITSYHPVGTCKMGAGGDSVVDFDFRVKGTNKLFVVDASVIPSLPSGNVNGAVMVLAEMAVDKIRFQYFLSLRRCSAKEIFVAKRVCYT